MRLCGPSNDVLDERDGVEAVIALQMHLSMVDLVMDDLILSIPKGLIWFL